MSLQVLACGDVRGNMVLFPLLKNLVLGTSVAQEMKIPPVNHFKGVHGISSVSSVVVTKLVYNQIEIRSVCLTIHPLNCDTIKFRHKHFPNNNSKSTVNINVTSKVMSMLYSNFNC
jgi:hypothetical protein